LSSGALPLSVRRCHFPNTFRPCRSSRLRRFAPPLAFQVCCALVPIVGFARFQLRRPRPCPFPRVCCADAQVLRLALSRPRGVWFGLRCGGQAVSSEEVLVRSLQRPARPMVAWSFPLALHPSKLFPCRQPVPRQPFLAPAPRSVQEPPGEPGISIPCETLQPSGSGHRGPCPLAVVHDSCALAWYLPRAEGAWQVCRDRSLDLRALFHRQVRSDAPTFPSTHRPMLPWALLYRGFAFISRRSLLAAVPMCRSTRRSDT
jgi:hypothetical protein